MATPRSAVEAPEVKVPVALQPFVVTTTVSETAPDDPAVNVIDGVVEPAVMVPPLMDHTYVVPAGPAATDAVLPVEPGTIVLGAVIVAEGIGLTVTLTGGALPVQPVLSVTVTLYEPVALTVIDCVVAPVDHAYDWPAVAVSNTLPPVQKLVGPLAVMVGANAATLTVADPLFGQLLPSVTDTWSVTADDDVGWNVIAFVPAPPVIVPFVMDHV